jgi:hypothetical protein
MTDEECADCLPWIRRWLAAREDERAPQGVAVPLRRGTDVLGREIVSVVVDDYDLIRMCRVTDAARTPPSIRIANGHNLFDSLESVHQGKRDQIRDVVAHVRQTRSHVEIEIDSAYVPGERRLIRAHPGTRRGWVALSMLAIPAVRAADDDDDDDLLVAQR